MVVSSRSRPEPHLLYAGVDDLELIRRATIVLILEHTPSFQGEFFFVPRECGRHLEGVYSLRAEGAHSSIGVSRHMSQANSKVDGTYATKIPRKKACACSIIALAPLTPQAKSRTRTRPDYGKAVPCMDTGDRLRTVAGYCSNDIWMVA